MKEKLKIAGIFLLGIVTIFLVFFHFTDTPNVWVDEGVFSQTAENIALHGVQGLQIEPGRFFPLNTLLSTGYPVIYPLGAIFRIFGTGLWQARMLMAVYMLCLVALFYVFIRKRYGFYPAILSGLSLISFSPFYGNGRPVQGEVPGLVFLMLGGVLLLYFEQSNFKNKRYAFFAGVAIGLASATKPLFLILISVALIITLFAWFRKIQEKRILIFFGIGFLIPIILWACTVFPDIHSLKNIFFVYAHLAGNHSASVSVAHTLITNLKRFVTESTPMLFSFLCAIIACAVGLKIFISKHHDFSISECVIASFIVLNFGAYLVGTGWYRYFFPAHVLLYVFFPVAIFVLAGYVPKKSLKIIILAIPVVLICVQLYHLIFLSDTSFVVTRTRNADIALALHAIQPQQKVLFYNTPEAVIFLKGDNYSQYLAMEDFLEAGNKNAMASTSADFVLTNVGEDTHVLQRCYSSQTVNKYVLFKRIVGACK